MRKNATHNKHTINLFGSWRKAIRARLSQETAIQHSEIYASVEGYGLDFIYASKSYILYSLCFLV